MKIKRLLGLEKIDFKNISVQNILLENSIQADILRLDKIHSIISGNKYFKLKYNLKEAIEKGYKTVLTYGGYYSNHIVATAYSGKLSGLDTIGLIRGEKPKNISHTLLNAIEYGMNLKFISRTDYKNKSDINFIQELKNEFGDFYIIPEGGDNQLGRSGSKEILETLDYKKYTHIISAIGTGTMFFGLVNSSDLEQNIIGIPVLKGMDNFLNDNIQKVEKLKKLEYCKIIDGYHFDGYAKKNQVLIDFMNSFYQKTNIPTDFVYTAKLLYAFFDLIKNNYFPDNSKILLIHSGGLQGNLSLSGNELVF